MLGNRIRGHCIQNPKLVATLVLLVALLATQGTAAASGVEMSVDPSNVYDVNPGP